MKKLLGLFLIAFSAVNSPAALSRHWNSVPTDIVVSNAIAVGMSQAVATFNTYSDYTYDIGVAHNTGVPTAQASYHGIIEFGGSIDFRVSMHEMCHWLGTHVNNAIQAYEGPTAVISGDTQHFWPYGWNYDNEAVNPERLVGMVGGMLRDMGIQDDKMIGFAPGTYRLRNRDTTRWTRTTGAFSTG